MQLHAIAVFISTITLFYASGVSFSSRMRCKIGLRHASRAAAKGDARRGKATKGGRGEGDEDGAPSSDKRRPGRAREGEDRLATDEAASHGA
ncbi:hypothetical protein GBS0709_03150 [Edwardsiella tarda]|nr:hypothetical protein GBS0709_03150 [Edwardsiella tarda]